jgi:sugar-specific transcriptional regulator TrmB
MLLTVEEEEFKILSDLGLSHKQAIIYLTLLKLGVDSKAVSIFKFSNVARQDVYRILFELQKIGIVQKIISKPTKFHAVQPRKAVSILLERKTNAMTTLKKQAAIFTKLTCKTTNSNSCEPEKDAFIIISQKSGVIQKCQEIIERTHLSIDSITPSREFIPWIEVLFDAFNKVEGTGIRRRWIIEKPRKDNDLRNIQKALTQHPVHVRSCQLPPVVKFGIYDNNEVILAISKEGKFVEASALWSNSPAIVEMAKSYFEIYWENGTDVEPIKLY